MSHQLLSILPAAFALLLVLLFAAPMEGDGLIGTPNVAWLMTLVMVAFYPDSWPRGYAFFLGLLQDILFATPLGSQALLALILAQLTAIRAEQQQTQLFRLRWMEAAGVLIVWHILLWGLMHAVVTDGPNLTNMLRAGITSALWYPIFYGVATRLFGALPDAK
ncbi:MAG: rod shape-determining protein MreD [Rickettsiales bacterium]